MVLPQFNGIGVSEIAYHGVDGNVYREDVNYEVRGGVKGFEMVLNIAWSTPAREEVKNENLLTVSALGKLKRRRGH